MGDHPRSRGEHVETSLGDDGHLWIIPARAGSTTTWRQPRPHPRDHPRSRGEHARPMEGERANRGSSPLARGARMRRRGRTADEGSSPLARGALGAFAVGGGEQGIIPARAGSTWERAVWRAFHEDHPRSRGEHGLQSFTSEGATGSSPLARGAQGSAPPPTPSGRIIPARAGSTTGSGCVLPSQADHPRSRGEHYRKGECHVACSGSSPLARGALTSRSVSCFVVRIIPARAGSTCV